jgi:hypothetical protein
MKKYIVLLISESKLLFACPRHTIRRASRGASEKKAHFYALANVELSCIVLGF